MRRIFVIAHSGFSRASNHRPIGPAQSTASVTRSSCWGSQGNEPDRLKEAVEAYLLALEEWTRGRAPAEWATAQSDLGNALKALGGQTGKHETLRAAAEAYRAALSEMRRQEKTCGWAQTCKSLGDTLAILGIEENEAERLIDAVDAYQDALGWIDRELFPAQWASAQVNLGNALQALAEMEKGSRRLHQAALAYQEVLRDGTLCRTTLAAANDNLGSVLAAIGERENSAAKLREAASAYRAALDACPEDEAPLDAAKTHINLAYTLSALWNRLRQPQALDEALLAADAALRLIEKAGAREEMTEAKLARAAILSAMGKGKMEAA
ncbi:MAG: hypothetical protein J2P49_11455 [Methylocapsa sp.]|nr:hypothetical protein [Methylocapsa sp.]